MKKIESPKSSTFDVVTANVSGRRLPLVSFFIIKVPNHDVLLKLICPLCQCIITLCYSQENAWMDQTFSNCFFFLQHFVSIVRQYLESKSLHAQILLIMANTPSHPSAESPASLRIWSIKMHIPPT